jgi:hypothetical protein
MTVYVVLGVSSYEGEDFKGVFSTRELAKAYAVGLKCSVDHGFEIHPVELDKPYDRWGEYLAAKARGEGSPVVTIEMDKP